MSSVWQKSCNISVSADGVLIAGMHLHFPAFARLARRGDAYALYPEYWIHDINSCAGGEVIQPPRLPNKAADSAPATMKMRGASPS